jgi:hypothetical protein
MTQKHHADGQIQSLDGVVTRYSLGQLAEFRRAQGEWDTYLTDESKMRDGPESM